MYIALLSRCLDKKLRSVNLPLPKVCKCITICVEVTHRVHGVFRCIRASSLSNKIRKLVFRLRIYLYEGKLVTVTYHSVPIVHQEILVFKVRKSNFVGTRTSRGTTLDYQEHYHNRIFPKYLTCNLKCPKPELALLLNGKK